MNDVSLKQPAMELETDLWEVSVSQCVTMEGVLKARL
jgi:hypothetical protein